MSIKCTHVAVQRGSIDISPLCACGANVVVPFIRDNREDGKENAIPEATNYKTLHFRQQTSFLLQAFNISSMKVEEWLSESLTEPPGSTRQSTKRISNARTDWITHSLGVRTALDRMTATGLDLLPIFPVILHSHCFSHSWTTLTDLTWMNDWLTYGLN